MSSYLITQKNLMDFNGDVPYFEFMMNYCPPGTGFGELKRLIDGISDCAGYRNEFQGIVHIKLDYPSTLKTMRGLIALFEKGREYSHAIDLQKDLVNKSRDQNSPPAFFSNRDRFHLVEMYRDAGMLREAIQLADALLSELTEDLDPETVAQSLKSKSPSIDITGILQLRVFLQKYKRI